MKSYYYCLEFGENLNDSKNNLNENISKNDILIKPI